MRKKDMASDARMYIYLYIHVYISLYPYAWDRKRTVCMEGVGRRNREIERERVPKLGSTWCQRAED